MTEAPTDTPRIGVIDLERRRHLGQALAREGLSDALQIGANSRVEGFLHARGLGCARVVLLGSNDEAEAAAALVRALERGLADAAVLTPARPGLKGRLGGGALRLLSGAPLSRLPSGSVAVTAEALEHISVEELPAGAGFVPALLLALHERGRRVIELPAAVGRPQAGLRAALREGGRAWVARRRGVLGFPGPARLPASDAPSVTHAPTTNPAAVAPPSAEGEGLRAPKPLPLVSDLDDRVEREG